MNQTNKILDVHLKEGGLGTDEENVFDIDQVLMQDATGTMVTLQFMEMGLKEVQPKLVVCYIDHNMVQLDHRNPEDHRFLKSAGRKYGFNVSLPGNGICHQVNTERFARPGWMLVGSDSHTPTSGAVGCIGIGAGGLDVSLVLAGFGFGLVTPKVVGVHVSGDWPDWVSSKDLILEMLRRYSVKGGLGKIYEFTGPSVGKIGVPGRATISNMIAELGATAALFPSDGQTKRFLKEQQRLDHYKPLRADRNASYDEEIWIELDDLVPLVAKPHNPDNVVPVEELAGMEVAQVCLGSSVNSWFEDLAIPAAVVAKKGRSTTLDLTVSPGSRQILDRISRSGALQQLIHAGARILEPACGPCVGMGQAPPMGKPSVRTFNRNFKGRSGTIGDKVYLTSPATAGATALKGVLTDPRTLGEPPRIKYVLPVIDDSMIIPPLPRNARKNIKIDWGHNVKRPPEQFAIPRTIKGRVLIKLGNNISTGSMSPAGVIVMADRSNVPAISRFVFAKEDPDFVDRAIKWNGGFIVAGDNYGQGSSREHAAMAPKHLGIKAVLARSFARIHRRNLISQGIVPIPITKAMYRVIGPGATIDLSNIRACLGSSPAIAKVKIGKKVFKADLELSDHERRLLLVGGALRWARLEKKKR